MISGVKLFRTLIAGAVIAVAGASPLCAAAPADADGATWGLPQLMRGMAQVKSERRQFTEKKYLKVLTAPLESSGVLVYRAPGHVEKLTLQPRKESMVLDQGIIEIVEPSRHLRRTLMANQYPAVAALVESMRATLAGDTNALTRYYRTTVRGAAAHWHLQLVPLDAAARDVVREIRIEGRANRIAGIEIIGVDGDRTVVAVGDALPPDGKAK
jgi:hypothetical protein